jgi:hypothetical protein
MGCVLYIRCALSIHKKECRKNLGCALYIGARYLPENTVIYKIHWATPFLGNRSSSSSREISAFYGNPKHFTMFATDRQVFLSMPILFHFSSSQLVLLRSDLVISSLYVVSRLLVSDLFSGTLIRYVLSHSHLPRFAYPNNIWRRVLITTFLNLCKSEEELYRFVKGSGFWNISVFILFLKH